MWDILRENGCRGGPQMRDFICGTNAFTASQGGKIRRCSSVDDVGRGGLVAEA